MRLFVEKSNNVRGTTSKSDKGEKESLEKKKVRFKTRDKGNNTEEGSTVMEKIRRELIFIKNDYKKELDTVKEEIEERKRKERILEVRLEAVEGKLEEIDKKLEEFIERYEIEKKKESERVEERMVPTISRTGSRSSLYSGESEVSNWTYRSEDSLSLREVKHVKRIVIERRGRKEGTI